MFNWLIRCLLLIELLLAIMSFGLIRLRWSALIVAKKLDSYSFTKSILKEVIDKILTERKNNKAKKKKQKN